MADPKYCPRPGTTEVLHSILPPGVLGFLVACPPGTMKEVYCTRADLCVSGCAIDKAIIPFQIKWSDIVSGGRTAPGGNRYWSTTISADPRDPRVSAVLHMLASRSASVFVETWGKVTAKDMAYVMSFGTWTTNVGLMTVPVMPIPKETPAAFVARGGYLFDMRPAFSPIINGSAWQKQGASLYSWLVDTDVKSVELWGNYDPAAGKVNYTYRIVYRGKWESTVNSIGKGIDAAGRGFCNKLTQNAGYASTAAMTFPSLAPYAAVYTSALAVCGIASAPSLPCIPREPRPEDGVALASSARVTIGSGAGTSPPVKGGKPGVLVMPSITETGALTVSQNPTGITYPAGTIAWENIKGAGFDVAVPQQGGSALYHIMQRGLPAPPPNARVVDRTEWEKAVFPWLQRYNVKVGLGVAAATIMTAAVVAALRVRAKR